MDNFDNNLNNTNKVKYRIFVSILFVFLLLFGIVIGLGISDNKFYSKESKRYIDNNEKINNINIQDKEKDNINSNEDINYTKDVISKNSDIELIYIDKYLLCDEEIKKENTIYNLNLEKVKENEIEKQNKENVKYELIEEENNRLVFKREVNEYCPNHYLVKYENDLVNIYNRVDNDNIKLNRSIDVKDKLIRKEMIQELEKGIKLDKEEDLIFLIEDLES